MDKNTLSNYGWIVIAVLVLSVMIALATPFGQYVEQGVRSTTTGLFDTSEKAMNVVGMSASDGDFEDGYTSTGSSSEPEQVVGSATFEWYYDGANYILEDKTLTWEELQLTENITKYGFATPPISNTSINNNGFYACPVVRMTIQYGITKIGDYAFWGCNDLTSITIPNTVTSIGESAFADCYSLNDITYTGTMAQWGKIILGFSCYGGNTPATVVHCIDGDVAI